MLGQKIGAISALLLAALHRMVGGDYMLKNPILARMPQPSPLWLLTLLTVLEIDRYPLEVWNEALSAVAGRRVHCPSYRSLIRRVEEEALTRQ